MRDKVASCDLFPPDPVIKLEEEVRKANAILDYSCQSDDWQLHSSEKEAKRHRLLSDENIMTWFSGYNWFIGLDLSWIRQKSNFNLLCSCQVWTIFEIKRNDLNYDGRDHFLTSTIWSTSSLSFQMVSFLYFFFGKKAQIYFEFSFFGATLNRNTLRTLGQLGPVRWPGGGSGLRTLGRLCLFLSCSHVFFFYYLFLSSSLSSRCCTFFFLPRSKYTAWPPTTQPQQQL